MLTTFLRKLLGRLLTMFLALQGQAAPMETVERLRDVKLKKGTLEADMEAGRMGPEDYAQRLETAANRDTVTITFSL